MIEYLIKTDISAEFQDAIDILNGINYQENNEIIDDEIFIVSVNDMTENFPNRFPSIANDTFGLAQSFLKNQNQNLIHLIIINENMCQDNNVNLVAVILHELGHILNEFGRQLTLREILTQKLTQQEISVRNQEIKLENEHHADYFAKEYGYGNEQIKNLQLSLNKGFNDNELQSRITELKSEKIRMTNTVRIHTI